MKAFQKLFLTLLAGIALTGCDLLPGGSAVGYEVETISFQKEEDGKWGIISLSDGSVLVKPRFDRAPTPIINGRFSVYDSDADVFVLYAAEEKPHKIGQYKDIGAFTGKLCPVIDKNDKLKFIDRDGNTAFELKKIKGKQVTAAHNFYFGRAAVQLEDDKWGFVDEKGEVAVPCKFAKVEDFYDGIALVVLDNEDDTVDEKVRWGAIDRDGNMLFTKKYGTLRPEGESFVDGMLITHDSRYRSVVIDRNGDEVRKFKEGIGVTKAYSEGIAIYNDKTEKSGIVKVDGTIVLAEKYSDISYNGKLILADDDNDRTYVLDDNGKKKVRLPQGIALLLSPEYRNYDKLIFLHQLTDKYALLDDEGKKLEAQPNIYDWSAGYYQGVARYYGSDYVEEAEEAEEDDDYYYDEDSFANDSVAVYEDYE